jgi:predicted nucleotidyltransferase
MIRENTEPIGKEEMGKRMTLEEVKAKILPVLDKHDVIRASLFGSVARDESDEKSDVDILVELSGEKSLLDLAGLKIELEEILGRGVDVLTYESLHPLLKDRILSEQKVIL